MSAENNFDQIIKKRLSEGTADGSSPNWEGMSSALSQDEFDRSIKNKIPETEGTASWAAFVTLIDAEETAAQDTFDEIVTEKLDTQHLSGSANWSTFSKIMDSFAVWRRKLWTSRALEALVIILLILFIGSNPTSHQLTADLQSSRVQENPSTESRASTLQSRTENVPSIISESDKDTPATENISAHKTQEDSDNNQNKLSEYASDQINSSEQNVDDILSKKAIQLDDATIYISAENNSDNSSDKSSSESDNDSIIFNDDGETSSTIVSAQTISTGNNTLSTDLKTDLIDNTDRALPIILSSLGLKNSSISLQEPKLSPSNVRSIEPIRQKLSSWSYGYHLTSDLAQITSAPDPVLGLNRYRRYDTGWGVGFRVNKKMGRWHLESGFSLHLLHYAPRSVYIVRGRNIDESFDGLGITEIKMFSSRIPLEFQYNFIDNENIRLYGIIGSNANLHMRSSYTTSEVDITVLDNNTGNQFAIQTQDPVDIRETPAEFRDRSFDSGLSGGQNIFQASYLTLNTGIGIDYIVKPRLAVFATYRYRHRFGGEEFGPYRDQFRFSTLMTGIRVRLTED